MEGCLAYMSVTFWKGVFFFFHNKVITANVSVCFSS